MVAVCDRLDQRPGAKSGAADGAESDRSLQTRIIDSPDLRTGTNCLCRLVSPAPNTHDSLGLQPLVRGIPPIRPLRGPRRRCPDKLHADRATNTTTCDDDSGAGESGTASPARGSSPSSVWAATAGLRNGPCHDSPAADASTDATNARPKTSSPSSASPQPSSATAFSPEPVLLHIKTGQPHRVRQACRVGRGSLGPAHGHPKVDERTTCTSVNGPTDQGDISSSSSVTSYHHSDEGSLTSPSR